MGKVWCRSFVLLTGALLLISCTQDEATGAATPLSSTLISVEIVIPAHTATPVPGTPVSVELVIPAPGDIPTPIEIPYPTPRPTSRPTPTLTPIPTPWPTPTPPPTSTPAPTPTATPKPPPIPIDIHLSNGGAGDYSQLWGESGELWDPKSRLPDFSFAGYHMGEDPIPDVPVKLNVNDFGAKGDGVTDDSQAFLDAIEAIEDGAIFIPPGRYKITQVIEINKSNVVLRGAGSDSTVLYFPKHLGDIQGPGDAPTGTPYYSWEGGLISIAGSRSIRHLADVVSEASRGDYSLELSSTSSIIPGQTIWLRLKKDPDGTLLRHLHAEELDGGDYATTVLVRFASRVNEVMGNTIILERPLPTDIRLNWEPEIYDFADLGVTEVGIENLTMEFPQVLYSGHQKELGYNAIEVRDANNCWIRNLKILHADNGIFFRRAQFCTIQGVEFSTTDQRAVLVDGGFGKNSGHHAIQVAESDDNLITEFNIDTVFVHDLTITSTSRGNVFSNGKGVDLAFDHHIRVPFENLFTDIDVGFGRRIWISSGSIESTLSPHSGARETFWNIRSGLNIGWPTHQIFATQAHNAVPWGPDQLNLVGLTTDSESNITPGNPWFYKWFEVIRPVKLFPPDLHLAQLARRLRDRFED